MEGVSTRVPLKLYFAARSGRRLELAELAERLAADGLSVTSRWVTDALAGDARSGRAAALAAARDLEDLARADVLVAFTEQPGAAVSGRGGRHVELGAALALGKPVLVVGPAEHVFHHLPDVTRVDDWPSAELVLAGLMRKR